MLRDFFSPLNYPFVLGDLILPEGRDQSISDYRKSPRIPDRSKRNDNETVLDLAGIPADDVDVELSDDSRTIIITIDHEAEDGSSVFYKYRLSKANGIDPEKLSAYVDGNGKLHVIAPENKDERTPIKVKVRSQEISENSDESKDSEDSKTDESQSKSKENEDDSNPWEEID